MARTHRRHWFFKADLWVDGQQMPENLMDIVKSTLEANKGNSVIGFKDNSSAIRGGAVTPLLPATPGGPAPLAPQVGCCREAGWPAAGWLAGWLPAGGRAGGRAGGGRRGWVSWVARHLSAPAPLPSRLLAT